jgi:hypothetical protein
VTGSDLPYPEGVAAAEVLKVGAGEAAEENRSGSGRRGHRTGAVRRYPLLAKLGLVAEEASGVFRLAAGNNGGGGLHGADRVGHLVGLAGPCDLAGSSSALASCCRSTPPVAASGTDLADFVRRVPRQDPLHRRRDHRRCRDLDPAAGDRPDRARDRARSPPAARVRAGYAGSP